MPLATRAPVELELARVTGQLTEGRAQLDHRHGRSLPRSSEGGCTVSGAAQRPRWLERTSERTVPRTFDSRECVSKLSAGRADLARVAGASAGAERRQPVARF